MELSVTGSQSAISPAPPQFRFKPKYCLNCDTDFIFGKPVTRYVILANEELSSAINDGITFPLQAVRMQR